MYEKLSDDQKTLVKRALNIGGDRSKQLNKTSAPVKAAIYLAKMQKPRKTEEGALDLAKDVVGAVKDVIKKKPMKHKPSDSNYLRKQTGDIKDDVETEEGVVGAVASTGYKIGRNVTKAAGHVAMGVGKAAVRSGERTKNVVKGVKKAAKQLGGNNLQRVFTKEESEVEGFVGGTIGAAIGATHGSPVIGYKVGSTIGDVAAVGAAAYAAHKVYKIGKKVVTGSAKAGRGAAKAGGAVHSLMKRVQNKHIKTKKGQELHHSFDPYWEDSVIMSEEQHNEMIESMSIHVKPHPNGTHYTVHKVGAAMKKHGGIKKGEKLSDTEIDDAGQSGIKVHHESVHESYTQKYANFISTQIREVKFKPFDSIAKKKDKDDEDKLDPVDPKELKGKHDDRDDKDIDNDGDSDDSDKFLHKKRKKITKAMKKDDANGDAKDDADESYTQRYANFITGQNLEMSPSNFSKARDNKEPWMVGEQGSLGFQGASALGKSKDSNHKDAASHIDYHVRKNPDYHKPGDTGVKDRMRHAVAKKLGYSV
jgi:hypothetical protein